MSQTKVPPKVVTQLWVRAGGRCQFRGCNQALWRDDLTQREINNAYIAHIVADSPDGPRGDVELSPKLAKDFSNLMLLCPTHHNQIDRYVEEYPVELLLQYKHEHEKRIEQLTSIDESVKTHLLLFYDNIGNRKPAISIEDARVAVLPRYPAEASFIEINLSGSPYRDYEPSYFQFRQDEISRLVERRIRQRSHSDSINHLSIFAFASMPLLIHFGYEVGDTIPSDIYQPHRDVSNPWKWRSTEDKEFRYLVDAPEGRDRNIKSIALNLSLSDSIQPEVISQIMQQPYSTYKLTIPSPNRNYLQSKEQLELFKVEMRVLLRQIKEVHGNGHEIHLFPAVPASIAVSFGQLLLPKTDPPIHIYEYNHRSNGTRYALTVSEKPA